MRTMLRLVYFAILFGLIHAASPAAENSAKAPYFVIPGNHDDGSQETLPLKSSHAVIRIDGTIARVRLTQQYGNTGPTPIEALYVFPASTRAAVHGMTLTTGGRVIAARIRRSEQAQDEYRAAKAAKKTAALLEEKRPNVFQMSVANLMPGDDVKVEIEWTETIHALDATYEFVFPTVVGPRYTGGSTAADAPAWAANPYLKQGTPNPATLRLELDLATALPLAEVTSPSHPVAVDFQSKDRARVEIDARAGEDAANRDFILRWKLGGDQVDAGLLLHRGKSNNHFLLQIEPPARVAAEHVPPRDYVMILDVSGSMNGFPLDTATMLLTELVNGLKTPDTFNIVCFASGSGLLSETPLPATESNLTKALKFINGQSAGGGTELEAALQRSLALPGGDDRSRTFLLVTDGYVTADDRVRDFIRANIGSANLFTFGIGSSVNRQLIESVARAGGGEPEIVTSASEAQAAAKRFLTAISSPVLAKVRIEGRGVTLGQIEPNPHPDVFASRPLVVTGSWTGETTGQIVVRGIAGGGRPFEKTIDLTEAAKSRGEDHPALPVLWARERVRRLDDAGTPGKDTVAEITRLGLDYSLLTRYTSFIAVDETPRQFEGDANTVTQPLPLPKGVSESAIGGAAMVSKSAGGIMVANGSVPEPGAIGLVSLLVVLLALQRRR